jgi:hypothetical protein
MPLGQHGFGEVITGGGVGSIIRVKACWAVCPTPSRTCNVNVLVWTLVGVPYTYAEYTP